MTFPLPPSDSKRSLLDVLQDRDCRSTALWLTVLMSSAYFLTAPGRIDIVDGSIRFDVTHNLIELGRPILTHRLPAVQAPNLDFYAFYQFGTSVLALPFVLVARWLAPGSINAEQFAFTLTTIPFAALTVALLFLSFVRLGLERRSARDWALVVGFGSMLWPYAGSTFDLAPQAFFLTLGMLAGADALLFDSRPLGILSGLGFFGLATIQETYLPLAAPVLLAVPRLHWREPFGNLRRPVLVWIGTGILAGFVAVLLYNYARFGDPFRTGRETVRHPLVGEPLTGLAGLFLSPAKSLFLYSPLHVLGLVGLVKLRRSHSGWVVPALATFSLQVLLVSCLAFWAGEWAWGPRYLLATAPLVLLGVPFALPISRRGIVRAFTVAAVLVQLLAISIDHQVYYVRKGLRSFFWVNNSVMYSDSPLLRRPREIWKALHFSGYRPNMKLVPGVFDPYLPPTSSSTDPDWLRAYHRRKPSERVVTSGSGHPPLALREARPEWVDDYYVMNAPRPWILWSAGLPPELRPVPLLPWLGVGLFGITFSAWTLYQVGSGRQKPASRGSSMSGRSTNLRRAARTSR